MKKLPETEAIFDRLALVNPAADADETSLRLSVDAKATIPLGLFSRGGYSRLTVKAWNHDFKPQQKVTPVGVFLPQSNELYLFLITGPLTADAIVDCIRDTWLMIADRFPTVRTLVLNLDNGPENHSRGTQFMKRLTELVIERVWGVLEQHWNGTLLDSIQTVLQFAKTMTYNRVQPHVKQISKTYQTGVKLSKQAMADLEHRFDRLAGLEKYFVRIPPLSA